MLVCEEHLLTPYLSSDKEIEDSDCRNEDVHDHTYCVSYNSSHTASDGDIYHHINISNHNIYFTPFVASPFEPSTSTSPASHAVYDNLDDTPATPPIQGLCIYHILNGSIATPLVEGTVTPSDEGNKLLVYILAYNTSDLLTPTLRPFSSLTSLPLSPSTSPLAHNDISSSSSSAASVIEPLHICLSTLISQQEQQEQLQEEQYSYVYESPLDRLTHKLKRMAVATVLKKGG